MSDLKVKKFFEKVTDKLKTYEEIGMAAELQGKNTSATTGILTLTKSNQNPLAGQSNGILYYENGVISSLGTNSGSNSVFTVTPSTGKIKILKAGRYLVIAAAYAYDQFTAGDRFYLRIQVNATDYNRFTVTELMSGTYQIIYLCQSYRASANDELTMQVLNYTAARGRVTTTISTTFQVMKLS